VLRSSRKALGGVHGKKDGWAWPGPDFSQREENLPHGRDEDVQFQGKSEGSQKGGGRTHRRNVDPRGVKAAAKKRADPYGHGLNRK